MMCLRNTTVSHIDLQTSYNKKITGSKKCFPNGYCL